MSFVVYDVETTGTNRHFDQILQFAAILTDDALNQIDSFQTYCRLMPHVVPSPAALAVNGLDIADITDPARPSHYDMVSQIRSHLSKWSPAVFLGFNSIRFDEEFLRHGFYQCLYPPYLTNTRPNIRADVLSLARAFAAFHPDQLIVPHTAEGKATFALRAFATANGLPDFEAHEAMADVEATLHICRLVARSAPELWSRFLRFAQRAAAQSFIDETDVFLLFEPTSAGSCYCMTMVGANSKPAQAHIHYCLNLKTDVEALRPLSELALVEALERDRDIVRKVRVNAAPMICPLYEAPVHLLSGETEEAWEDRAHTIKADAGFMSRLLRACERREPVYPSSPHVEQQLYELGFWPDADSVLLQDFHAAAWVDRVSMVGRFADRRLRQLARRLIFLEQPGLLQPSESDALTRGMSARRRGAGLEQSPPWTTIEAARIELKTLLATVTTPQKARLERYDAYLAALI